MNDKNGLEINDKQNLSLRSKQSENKTKHYYSYCRNASADDRISKALQSEMLLTRD